MRKLLLVAVLAMSMVLPVFAAGSATATPEETTQATTTTTTTTPAQKEAAEAKSNATVQAAGAEVKVLTVEVLAAVNDVVTNTTHLTNLGVNTNAELAAAFDLKVEIPAGQSSVTVPIKVNNAQAGDYAYVLHRRADGQWEVVGQGYLGADLSVNATFTSFSPVAIMVVDAAEAGAAGVKSPKTGEY